MGSDEHRCLHICIHTEHLLFAAENVMQHYIIWFDIELLYQLLTKRHLFMCVCPGRRPALLPSVYLLSLAKG